MTHAGPASALRLGIVLCFGATLLAGCASPPIAVPSTTPSASKTLTSTERDQVWADAMVACLRAAGWEAEGSDGGVSAVGGVPEAQYGAYTAAVDTCTDQIGTTAITTPLDQWTDEQWTALYAAETATAACLRTEGFEVPPIPSRATFIDRYQSADQWTSYTFLPSMSQSRWNALNTRCPQPGV